MRPNSSPRPFVDCPSRDLNLAAVHRLRDRSFRDARGLFFSQGIRFLSRAVESSWPIAGLIVCSRLLNSCHGNGLVRGLVGEGIPRRKVSIEEYGSLSGFVDSEDLEERGQGVLVLARQRWEPLPEAVDESELWIGVESIRSSGNLGTLLRSGEAAGMTRLVVFDRSNDGSSVGVDPFAPACVRASMGSIFTHRYTRITHQDFRKWAREKSLRVFGACGEGAADYRLPDYRGPTMIMLGDERKGLSDGQRATCHQLIRIPMMGNTDSLNVAMAGTILLYEAYGKRHPAAR